MEPIDILLGAIAYGKSGTGYKVVEIDGEVLTLEKPDHSKIKATLEAIYRWEMPEAPRPEVPKPESPTTYAPGQAVDVYATWLPGDRWLPGFTYLGMSRYPNKAVIRCPQWFGNGAESTCELKYLRPKEVNHEH